jgi:RNA ligase (TIGR02306 family)
MRQLATIKKVNNILPIEGKDRIELAIFDGWQVIVKKGEFELGSLAVFVEIDSVLPERPEFEFLRSKSFRVKTMRMASVISQGICFPLDIFSTYGKLIYDDNKNIIGLEI